MRNPTPLAALVLGLLCTAPSGAALPAPVVGDPLQLVVDHFFSVDADGNHTLRLQLEDATTGTWSYTRADASNAFETLGGLLARAHPGAGQTLAGTREPVSEAGVFEHRWTHRGAPMTTLGVYVVHPDHGTLRAPLVILENIAGSDDLLAQAQALALDEGLDFAGHAVPFLTEYALPELGEGFRTWPTTTGSYSTFRDYPRVYAWTVKKSSPAGEVWEGAYLERLGWWRGGNTAAESFEGVKSAEVGVASRIHEATARLAGVYVETHLRKDAGNPQEARQRITVGAASEGTGRVPLAGVDLRDERAGMHQFSFPGQQRTGIVLGAYVQGQWTPLAGTWTEATHTVGANGDVEQTRLTSAGAYVQGSYVPLVGVRYHGDRSPLLHWVTRFVDGGTLGARTMGDWQVDLGTFAQGSFVPLVGATYADDFAGARFRYQAMVTAGVHTPLGYQPLVGATYDGERPLEPWAQAWVAGRRADTLDWMVTTGTFAPATPLGPGKYLPLLGLRFENDAPGASRAVQEHYTLGTFLGDYATFVPLLGLTWDGEQQHLQWATRFATGGSLGAAVGDWDVNGGTYPLGAWQPVVGVQYRNDYGAGAGGWAAQSFLTVGVWGPHGFEPLVGLSYSSSRPLVASLGNPASPTDDQRSFLTAGVFVQGSYVPLVMVENNGKSVNVGLLPPFY